MNSEPTINDIIWQLWPIGCARSVLENGRVIVSPAMLLEAQNLLAKAGGGKKGQGRRSLMASVRKPQLAVGQLWDMPAMEHAAVRPLRISFGGGVPGRPAGCVAGRALCAAAARSNGRSGDRGVLGMNIEIGDRNGDVHVVLSADGDHIY